MGKTLVSSSLIDRVVAAMGRRLVEVPVGFKHFVPGLIDGSVGFGGEESAGASFLRKDGTVWTTDKERQSVRSGALRRPAGGYQQGERTPEIPLPSGADATVVPQGLALGGSKGFAALSCAYYG